MKAPPVAQYLVQEILNHPDGSHPEVQGSEERASGTNLKRLSKRKQADRTYQPPKPSRKAPDILQDGVRDPHKASSGSPLLCDNSVTCEPGHDDVTIIQSNDSLVTGKTLQESRKDFPKIVAKEVPKDGVRGQSSARKQPSAILDRATEDSQTRGSPLKRTDQ